MTSRVIEFMFNYDDNFISNLFMLPDLRFSQIPFPLKRHQMLFPLKTDMRRPGRTATSITEIQQHRELQLPKVYFEYLPIYLPTF